MFFSLIVLHISYPPNNIIVYVNTNTNTTHNFVSLQNIFKLSESIISNKVQQHNALKNMSF